MKRSERRLNQGHSRFRFDYERRPERRDGRKRERETDRERERVSKETISKKAFPPSNVFKLIEQNVKRLP